MQRPLPDDVGMQSPQHLTHRASTHDYAVSRPVSPIVQQGKIFNQATGKVSGGGCQCVSMAWCCSPAQCSLHETDMCAAKCAFAACSAVYIIVLSCSCTPDQQLPQHL